MTVLRWIKGFARFWWDFLIGDDWTRAAVVVAALVAADLLARAGVNAWWLVPLASIGVVSFGVVRR
jgi:hypothetical protein